MTELEEKARQLMLGQTEKNKAPAWLLTELAVGKGRELAKKHGVSEELVVVSLYLAHTVFDRERNGVVQKNHEQSSAEFAKSHLDEWNVPADRQEIIINAIQAHHAKISTNSLTAEVAKNAECFKFVTLKGALIFLHELGIRNMPFNESVEYVLDKMNQKKKLLTLEGSKKEAEEECKKIEKTFK